MTNPTWLQKNLENADEVRDFPNDSGSLLVFHLGEETVAYSTHNVGWKWSTDMREAAGTDRCRFDPRCAPFHEEVAPESAQALPGLDGAARPGDHDLRRTRRWTGEVQPARAVAQVGASTQGFGSRRHCPLR